MKSAIPIEARLHWLRRFRDAIALHHVDLAQLAQQEIGKSGFAAFATRLRFIMSISRSSRSRRLARVGSMR